MMKNKARIKMILLCSILLSLNLSAQELFEPPDGTIYHGVGWDRESQNHYMNMFSQDQQPLLFQIMSAIPGTRTLTVEAILQNLQPDNMDPETQFAEFGVHFHIDQQNPTDSVFALTDTYDHLIDTPAEAFIMNNKPFFLRIGGEMNGVTWTHYTPWIFPQAYRKLVTGLRNRGVTNMALVWCYEPDAPDDFADSTEQGWKWYVGDDMADWFGLDLFDADHFDPDLPDEDRGNLTKKGRTEKFLQFAEERGKPVYLNELSARNVNITPDSLDPDSLDGIHDWEYWFKPFFEFLDLHPSVKALNYINLLWTPIEQYKTWGDSRIEINTYIRKRWIQKMNGSRFLHRGTDLNDPVTSVDYQKTGSEMPSTYPLLQTYPNPFNGSIKVIFQLTKEQNVKLNVFNMIGQKIRTLTDNRFQKGIHHIFWNANDLPSGTYIIRIATEEEYTAIKVVFVK